MKKLVLIFIALAFIATGCIVKSLHPFYLDEDVIFTEKLLGNWIDQDSASWNFKIQKVSTGFMEPEKDDDSYRLMHAEDGDTSYLNVHIFNLNGIMYFDFLPLGEENIGDDLGALHFIPSHSIARAEWLGDDNMAFFWYDQEWLNELFEQKRIKISHETVYDAEGNKEYVLTAGTTELQKFIAKYGPENDLFRQMNLESIRSQKSPLAIQKRLIDEYDRVSGNDNSLDFIFISMRRN